MVMNNLNNAMPGVPVDPMAQKQQMQQPIKLYMVTKLLWLKETRFLVRLR